MQLKVLLHFFEKQFYSPTFFVQKSNLFGCYIKIVGQKLKVSVPFILVTYFPQTDFFENFQLPFPIFIFRVIGKFNNLVAEYLSLALFPVMFPFYLNNL